MSQQIYPVAETFLSIQGEGVWTGTPMFFVRLAGCNVGKYEPITVQLAEEVGLLYDPDHVEVVNEGIVSKSAHSVCTNCFGEKFICDTDYQVKERLTAEQIATLVKESGALHVCLTGGEPFIHNLDELLLALRRWHVHIETSGTKPIRFCGDAVDGLKEENIWVTCSPKAGFLPANFLFIDEWKFVAGPDFEPKQVDEFFCLQGYYPAFLDCGRDDIFIQPVNHINEVDQASLTRVLEILKLRPGWRLSVQLHKFLGVR